MVNAGLVLNIVCMVLFIVGFIICMIGLVKPKAVVRWKPEHDRTRSKVLKSFGVITILSLIGIISTLTVTAEYSQDTRPILTSQPTPTSMAETIHRTEPIVIVKPMNSSEPKELPKQTVAPLPKVDKTEGVNTISAEIIKVVDGDTMKVTFNGKKETIRLLLVDTPETVSPSQPVQPFGPEASAFAKETLNGQKVEIEIDVSERDKYGRLLCYLYVGGQMFQEMLLEKGLARVAYIYPPNVKYVDQFREIQKIAQKKGVGIWSIENYAQEDGFHEELVEGSASNSADTSSASQSNGGSQIAYKSCTEVKKAGKAPLKKGQPGYSTRLDRDGDGVACEN